MAPAADTLGSPSSTTVLYSAPRGQATAGPARRRPRSAGPARAPRKRALLTDPFHELHGDLAPREIAVEVEQKRLHRHLARPKRRPPSHVGGAAVPARPGVDRGRVDAERRQDLARRRGQVGRWKADRPPAAVAP